MFDLIVVVVVGNFDLKVMVRRVIRGIIILGIVGMCGGCILLIFLFFMVFFCKVEIGIEFVILGKLKFFVGFGNNYVIFMVFFSSYGV